MLMYRLQLAVVADNCNEINTPLEILEAGIPVQP